MSSDDERPRKRRRVHVPITPEQAREELQQIIQRRDVKEPFKVVVLSGAGLDQPSGVPTYNGLGATPTKNGRSHDLFEYTSGEDIRVPWRKAMILRRRVHFVKDSPNAAREVINKIMSPDGQYELGWRTNFQDAIEVYHITQNITGLARLSLTGSLEQSHPNLIELHGRINEERCPVCKFTKFGLPVPPSVDLEQELDDIYIPLCPRCQSKRTKSKVQMMPAIVNEKTRIELPRCLDDCDLMLVVGTRGKVDPAGLFPEHVQRYQKSGKMAQVFYFNFGPPARKGQYTRFIDGSCAQTIPIALDYSSTASSVPISPVLHVITQKCSPEAPIDTKVDSALT